MNSQDTYPVEAPGVIIQDELEARGWIQADLAYILGKSEQSINRLINGKIGISPDMAKLLADAFDVPAEFFTNLQNSYDLYKAKEPSPAVKQRATFQNQYPVRNMIKRGWFEDTESALLEEQMKRFFMVDNVTDIPHLSLAAKKSSSYAENLTPEQCAWFYRAYHVAQEVILPTKYSKSKLKSALSALKKLRSEPEEIRHVPRILNECGIRFVIVECLPKSKIDGACFWLDKASPVVVMSLRFDRLDNFWFVLRHELEHVLQGYKDNNPIVDSDIDGSTDELPDEEIEANQAAAEFCVPQDKMNSFFLRKTPYISKDDMLMFSRRMGINPALVVGQIHFRNGRYHTFKDYLVAARKHIIPSSLVDGWGEVAPIEL